MNCSSPKAVVKVDKLTREVVESYKSIYEAAKQNNLAVSTVKAACDNRSLPSGRCYYRFAADYDKNEDFADNFNCPIVLMDVTKGVSQLRWFPSITACCEEMQVPRYELLRAKAGRRLLRGKYAVRYCRNRLRAKAREEGCTE